MKSKNPGVIVGWVLLGIVAFTAFVAGFGWLVQVLWNWLMPAVFGLGVITFWQAIGILLLFKILFGGFSGGKGGGHKWKHNKNQWKNKNGHDHSKWKYYDQFWEEEGEQALNDYIARKKGQNSGESELATDHPST